MPEDPALEIAKAELAFLHKTIRTLQDDQRVLLDRLARVVALEVPRVWVEVNGDVESIWCPGCERRRRIAGGAE